jgi:hypothetical protein
MNTFYCSSLANPAASHGECARWSIFNSNGEETIVSNRLSLCSKQESCQARLATAIHEISGLAVGHVIYDNHVVLLLSPVNLWGIM